MENKLKEYLFDDMYADVHRWSIYCLVIFTVGIILGIKYSNYYYLLIILSIFLHLYKTSSVGYREP